MNHLYGGWIAGNDQGVSVTVPVGGLSTAHACHDHQEPADGLDTPPGITRYATMRLVAFAAIGALCARGWRGNPGGFAALAGAAMLTMLLFAGEASGELSAPQLRTSFPEWVRRWTIAASYTVVAPTFLAAALAGRWYARTRPDAGPSDVAAVSTDLVSTP